MKAIIFSNGDYRDKGFYQNYLRNSAGSFIIGADGGANFLMEIGICPDFLVGDMDSISTATYNYFKEKTIVEKYPAMKDQTDTEIAIQKAIELKATEVVIFGGMGDRIDHSLGNIYLLSRLLKKGIRGQIKNEKQEIILIDDEITLSYPVKTVVSILPIDGAASSIWIEGFLYPVENGDMTITEPYGISNVTNEASQKIRVGQGKLLIIANRE
ncbi:thiamine diphosphokinase [Eubacteriaceae bacterium ES3]|nr:thiamine diphosphokinase [Eubacteriaceae bacterium ES3]